MAYDDQDKLSDTVKAQVFLVSKNCYSKDQGGTKTNLVYYIYFLFVCVYLFLYTYVCIALCLFACLRVCVCVCEFVCVCICWGMCVCCVCVKREKFCICVYWLVTRLERQDSE